VLSHAHRVDHSRSVCIVDDHQFQQIPIEIWTEHQEAKGVFANFVDCERTLNSMFDGIPRDAVFQR